MLAEFVAETAVAQGVPGVAVGVWADGAQAYACHGVTSVDNPLPVDPDTLFVVGSVTKTYTATALMCLVADGRVELDAPVRAYLPELRLADERVAAAVTVRQLLNHTSGLDWGFTADTGEGDDALAQYVARLSGLKLIGEPGGRASYSQAGYNVVGRVIERVTGLTYERAIASMLFEPLGLGHSFFFRDDVMTRRFSVGHNPDADGNPAVARLWRRWRGENPGGGVVTSIADLLRWAQFHLGDGNGILPTGVLRGMWEPTVTLRASKLGDAIGTGWFLRDVDGVRTVGHGGSANGQYADLLLVPERNFAIVTAANGNPGGIPFNQATIRWALEHYLGVVDRDPEPLPFDEAGSRDLVGSYENDVMTLDIRTDGTGLSLDVRMRPEIRAASDRELPPDYPPAAVGLLPGDEYAITDGALRGQRGVFTRDERGAVVGIDLAGRLFRRVPYRQVP